MPVSRHLIIGCTTLSATRSPALAVSEAGDDLEWVDVLMIRVVPGPQGTLHHCTQEALVKYKVLFEKVSWNLCVYVFFPLWFAEKTMKLGENIEK